MDRISRSKTGKNIIYISLAANIFLAVFKIILGIFAASAALVADGFHSFADIITTLGVLAAILVSKQPPDEDHHYGHGQAEPLAAMGLGLILLGTAFFLGRDMLSRLIAEEIVLPGNIALIGIIVSLGIKETLYRYVMKVGEKIDSSALRADAWHHRSDAISSLAAGAGILGARLGLPLLDPLAGFVVALLIFRVSYKIFKGALSRLLGKGPSPAKIKNIESAIGEVEGVIEVGEVKGLYHGPHLYLDVKVAVEGEISVSEGHEIAVKVRKKVERLYEEAEEVLVHVDPAEFEEG